MDTDVLTDLVTSKQAAEILGISPGRVRQLIVRGDLPSVLVGRTRLIERQVVESFSSIARPCGRRPKKDTCKH